MASVTRKVLLTTFLTFMLGFAFFFVLSIYEFPTRDVLSIYKWRWILNNTLVQGMDAAISLQVTAILLTFSLFVHDVELRVGRQLPPSFARLIRSTIILVLVLMSVYFVTLEAFVPMAVHRREAARFDSSMAKELSKRIDTALKDGMDEEALAAAQDYLRFDPDNAEIQEQRIALMARVANRATPESPSSTSQAPGLEQGPGIGALIDQAQTASQREDYFSAYYYASRALALQSDNRTARQIAEAAVERIQSADLSKTEKRQADIFARKRKGLQELNAGDVIAAYYTFAALDRDTSDDADVAHFLAEAKREVSRITFFYDEIKDAAALPGAGRILFLNRMTDDEREVIYIGKLVKDSSGIYPFDVELLRFSADGTLRYHVGAPYGKVVNQYLVLHAIGRDEPSTGEKPTVYAGSQSDSEGPDDFVFPLSVPVDDLDIVAAGSGNLAAVPLISLWETASVLSAYGYVTQPVFLDMVMRLSMPFSFVVFSLFAIGLGWRYRSRYLTRPPLLAYPLLLGVPFIAYAGVRLAVYGIRIVSGAVELFAGFVPAVIAMIVLEGALLTLSLLFVAGQVTE